MLQSWGVLEQLKENVTIFFLDWLVIFFSETVELLADLFQNFEQAQSLENGRLYG